MALERTFSMIKPDATRRNLTCAITKMLEDAGLRVVATRGGETVRRRRAASRAAQATSQAQGPGRGKVPGSIPLCLDRPR